MCRPLLWCALWESVGNMAEGEWATGTVVGKVEEREVKLAIPPHPKE